MLVKRILVVDEQPGFRRGVRAQLEQHPHFRVVGEAGTAHLALRAAAEMNPHLVIVSDTLPGITGRTLIEAPLFQRKGCMAILLVPEIDDENLRAARRAGAIAVIQRSIDPAELIIAVGRALSTGSEGHRRPAATGLIAPSATMLSSRELEVLDCVVHGFSNKEIAHELYLTEQTVKNHMTSVFRKMKVDDRVQALLYAVRHGWVSFGPRRDSEGNQRNTA